jgi:hypothetical protein
MAAAEFSRVLFARAFCFIARAYRVAYRAHPKNIEVALNNNERGKKRWCMVAVSITVCRQSWRRLVNGTTTVP